MATSIATRLLVVCACAVVTACSSNPPGAPPVSASSAPSVQAPSAPSPTPVAPPPTTAQDLASAKRALLTARDLGKPWVQPKTVSTVGGKKDESCPGKPSVVALAPPAASATVRLTKGSRSGAGIGSFTVSTLPEGGARTYRAAWASMVKNCASFVDAAKFSVVVSSEGPTTIKRADEVLARTERIYYDRSHRQLAYARHVVSARTGRVVSTVEYAFLTTRSDPGAKNFAPVIALLEKQLAKTSATFTG